MSRRADRRRAQLGSGPVFAAVVPAPSHQRFRLGRRAAVSASRLAPGATTPAPRRGRRARFSRTVPATASRRSQASGAPAYRDRRGVCRARGAGRTAG